MRCCKRLRVMYRAVWRKENVDAVDGGCICPECLPLMAASCDWQATLAQSQQHASVATC